MSDATPRASKASKRMSPRLRRALAVAGVVLSLIAIWEVYKLVWLSLGWIRPIRPDDVVMPHVWEMVIELFRPVRRGGSILILDLGVRALWTMREAVTGFVVGGILGFGIGVLFDRSKLAERAFMPYVVGSQTVPILALAPMVVVFGLSVGVPGWISVASIAAYLTFFPVAINTLRGLRSPDPNSLELMRSLAATRSETLWKLKVPSALPYIFTALKVTATASIVGALIGELPVGFQNGLGRALLTFSQQFAVQSKKLYATVIVTAVIGILFVWVISFIEKKVIPGRSRDVTADELALGGAAEGSVSLVAGGT